MRLASSFRAYFRIRPESLGEAIRLFSAYATSVLLRVAIPFRFQSVGLCIRGDKNLRVRIDGIRFEIRPRTNDLDLVSPKHEPVTAHWFRVKPNDVVIDVGAHIGRYTLLASTSRAYVIAIEPDPSNFQLLEKNVRLNGRSNVLLVRAALTSVPGALVLSIAQPVNTGTSYVKHSQIDVTSKSVQGHEVLVEGETLDHIVGLYGLSRIDWLKIDVEGHEIEVLEGANSAMDIATKLVLEVTETTRDACRRIAESHGFRLCAVERGDPASNLLLEKNGP